MLLDGEQTYYFIAIPIPHSTNPGNNWYSLTTGIIVQGTMTSRFRCAIAAVGRPRHPLRRDAAHRLRAHWCLGIRHHMRAKIGAHVPGTNRQHMDIVAPSTPAARLYRWHSWRTCSPNTGP